MARLRLGAPGDALTAPLLDGLDLPPWSDRVSLRVYRDDGPLAADLDARRLDLACLDAARLLARRAELDVVPGLAATTDGPGTHVRLRSTSPLDRVRTVTARDPGGAAALLCRVLFAESAHEIAIVGEEAGMQDPDARIVDAGADRPLEEGTAARAGDGHAASSVDLGAAWTELTGLPFVWRAWAALPGALDRATYAMLHSARTRGVRRSSTGSTGASVPPPGSPVYRLGRREIESLALLRETAVRHGVLSAGGDVRLARLPGASACDDAARRARDGDG